jgi:ferredoxin-NADP reductase
MAQNAFSLVLRSARMVTPRVRELSFARADGAPFDYTPGQFITLHLDYEGQVLRRSYSVATVAGSGEDIKIAVTHVDGGRATGLLFAMEPGDEVKAIGPYGRFVLRDDPPCRYLLVATGTGVSPYRAMLPELERRVDLEDFQVELLLGVRNRNELLYGEDFAAFAERHPGVTFHACYSRELPGDARVHEHKGYVQDHLQELDLDPERDIVYLCGNPDMIDVAAARLKEAGFPIGNVRREKYVSSN